MPSSAPFYQDGALDDIYRAAFGFQSWNFDPFLSGANASGLTSQTIFATALALRAGQEITNVCVHVATAGAGTAPTGVYVGLGTAKQMLAISGNLATIVTGTDAGSNWTAVGIKQMPLSLTSLNYIVPASGLYYVYVLINGTFSVTQVGLGRGGTSSNQLGITGGALPCATAGTGQTTLPAVGAAITLSSTSALNLWAGLS